MNGERSILITMIKITIIKTHNKMFCVVILCIHLRCDPGLGQRLLDPSHQVMT